MLRVLLAVVRKSVYGKEAEKPRRHPLGALHQVLDTAVGVYGPSVDKPNHFTRPTYLLDPV